MIPKAGATSKRDMFQRSLTSPQLKTTPESQRRKMSEMEPVLRCVDAAALENRLVYGLTAAVEQLQQDAAAVMLCILPVHEADVTADIAETLLKAYCRENLVMCLQVKDSCSLAKQLLQRSDVSDDAAKTGHDNICLLVKWPEKLSAVDRTVMKIGERRSSKYYTKEQRENMSFSLSTSPD